MSKPTNPALNERQSFAAVALPRTYYEEQKRKTLFALANPSLSGSAISYLKQRLAAIDSKLDQEAL